MSESELTLEQDLYLLFTEMHSKCHECLAAAVAREEITFAQLRLLLFLRQGRYRPTIKQAARVMGVSISRASRSIDELARRGLVLRQEDGNDSRSKRVVITDRGERIPLNLDVAQFRSLDGYIEDLSPEQRENLQDAISMIRARPAPEAREMTKAAA